jgi:uncharacterized membrane protein
MSPVFVVLLAFGIGAVGGLRSMTAPAIVAWAAHLGWINLSASPLAFLGNRWAVGVLTVFALGEFVADLIPSTPSRTATFPLTARVIVGMLTGAALAAAGGLSLWIGALVGAIGAIAGAFGGYRARSGLVRSLHTPDFAVAIPEDLVAIGLGLFFVSRF